MNLSPHSKPCTRLDPGFGFLVCCLQFVGVPGIALRMPGLGTEGFRQLRLGLGGPGFGFLDVGGGGKCTTPYRP